MIGNQPIELLFGFNKVVKDEEKELTQLIISSNINTGNWGYIEIQDFDGDLYTKILMSLILMISQLYHLIKDGFQYKVNLNKGFVVEKIEQQSPTQIMIDPND